MTLPTQITTLEKDKFEEVDGVVTVRTKTTGAVDALPRGLRTGGRITEISLNDSTWTALPATPLTGRNAVSIQNNSGQSIKINYNNAVVGFVGMLIRDGGERFYDIQGTIVIYAKSESGSANIAVEELA